MTDKVQVTQTPFGKVGEEQIWKFVLSNSKGTQVGLTNYGAAITEIVTLDKNDKASNIVLNFDTFDDYLNENKAYYGVIVGRCCNRIENARFQLSNSDMIIQVTQNISNNHLHGGLKGFDKKVYDFEVIQPNKLVLRQKSADGEEGYPGNLAIQIVYELTEDNEFKMVFQCTTDAHTICNLTSHSYFNLQTEKKQENCMKDHKVMINADYYTPMTDQCVPSGEIISVKNTPFDFTQPKIIQDSLCQQQSNQQLQIGNGLDHNYVVKRKSHINLIAKVSEQNSGRTLEIYSNQPGVQFYAGNYLSQVKGFIDRAGFCLETQAIPNSINHPHFPSVELVPGQTYEHITTYRFGVENI